MKGLFANKNNIFKKVDIKGLFKLHSKFNFSVFSKDDLLPNEETKQTQIDYSFNTNDFLSNSFKYEEQLNDVIYKYSLIDSIIEGSASVEGTKFFSHRNKENIHKNHFKKTYDDMTISSVGIGSYLGNPDDMNDFYLYNAIKTALLSGAVNMIDTAINYRYMKSEKAIGKALQILLVKYKIQRSEYIVASKVGFVPENAETGKRCHSYIEDLVNEGKITIEDVVFDDIKRPIHCIHPEYLKSQVDISLDNLKLKTLDVMYLHNVFESQYMVPKEILQSRLAKAFETMEEIRASGKIKNYGLATYNSLRVNDDNTMHCNLQEVTELAKKIGGENHGFRYVQAPINIMNPEVFIEKFQSFKFDRDINEAEQKEETLIGLMNSPEVGNLNKKEKNKISTTVTAICNHYKLNLITSSPLLQGTLIQLPMENKLFKLNTNPAKHIQLIRSIPADAIKSTLVGMKSQVHVKQNLEVSKIPPLTMQEFYEILTPKKRQPYLEKEIF